LNGREFKYNLGNRELNLDFYPVMGVPFPVACVIAENTPQALICPKTGEKFIPRGKNTHGIWHSQVVDGNIVRSGH